MLDMIINSAKLLAPTFLTNWIDGVSQIEKPKLQQGTPSPPCKKNSSSCSGCCAFSSNHSSNDNSRSNMTDNRTPTQRAPNSSERPNRFETPSLSHRRSPSRLQNFIEFDKFIPKSLFWQILYIFFWPITLLYFLNVHVPLAMLKYLQSLSLYKVGLEISIKKSEHIR